MGLDITFVEFQKDLVPPEKIDSVDTALFEGEPERIRQYLTYGDHLGPQLFRISIRQKLDSPFHQSVIDNFGFFKKGIHFLLTYEELEFLHQEFKQLNSEDHVRIDRMREFLGSVDKENLFTYIWC